MGTTPYLASHAMLQEHQQNIERAMSHPDWPARTRIERRPLRHHLGRVLRSLADWLDPQGARAGRVKLLVLPFPGEASVNIARNIRDL